MKIDSDTKHKWVVDKRRDWGDGIGKGVKRYKHPVIKYIRHRM